MFIDLNPYITGCKEVSKKKWIDKYSNETPN